MPRGGEDTLAARTGAGGAAARGGGAAAEEIFAVQYVVNTPDLVGDHGDDILFGMDDVPAGSPESGGAGAGAGGAGAGAGAGGGSRAHIHHQTASLTIRFCGKPVPAQGVPAALRSFQYAKALPSYLSRLVGAGRVILGDEGGDVEAAAADEAGGEQKGKKGGAGAGAGAGGEDEELVLGPYGLPMPPPRQTPLDM